MINLDHLMVFMCLCVTKRDSQISKIAPFQKHEQAAGAFFFGVGSTRRTSKDHVITSLRASLFLRFGQTRLYSSSTLFLSFFNKWWSYSFS